MHETGGDKPVCEEPKTLFFPYDECGWDYINDTSLVEKARTEEISVIRELGVWEVVVDRPVTRLCLAHGGLTSTRETKPNRSTAVVWSCKSMSVKPTGHFSLPLLRWRLCEVC